MNCAIVYYMQRLGITNLRKMAILNSPHVISQSYGNKYRKAVI